jgi:hypothetical protein
VSLAVAEDPGHGLADVLDLAVGPDQGDDDEGPGPGGEVVQDAQLDLGHGADRQGPDDGDVGQEHAHPVDAGAGLLLLVDRVGARLPGGREDEQVAEEPAGVDESPGGIGLAGREVHEAAVGHGQGDQPDADQGQGRDPRALAHPRLGQDEQDDGADDHVADRVGQADRLGQVVVLAHPPGQALGGEGKADQGGRGQRGRGQVANVGQ